MLDRDWADDAAKDAILAWTLERKPLQHVIAAALRQAHARGVAEGRAAGAAECRSRHGPLATLDPDAEMLRAWERWDAESGESP